MENANTNLDAIISFTEKAQDSMDSIDRQLSEVFINDKDFRALQKIQESLVEYSHAYELRETLRSRMMIDENFNGFYIFYHGYQKVWYHVDGNKIDAVHARRLREFLETQPQVQMGRNWKAISIEDKIYLIISFNRENVLYMESTSCLMPEPQFPKPQEKPRRLQFYARTSFYKIKSWPKA